MSNPIAEPEAARHKPAASPWLEWSYRISLSAKGLLGALQLIGGTGLWLSPGGSIRRLVDWMTRNELAQDPADPMAQRVIDWAQQLSPQTENFYAIYLLGHGLLNLGVVLALLLRLRGAYHLSLAILIGFVLYQLSQFAQNRDPVLLVLTLIDLLVIWLVVMERRHSGVTAGPRKPRNVNRSNP